MKRLGTKARRWRDEATKLREANERLRLRNGVLEKRINELTPTPEERERIVREAVEEVTEDVWEATQRPTSFATRASRRALEKAFGGEA